MFRWSTTPALAALAAALLLLACGQSGDGDPAQGQTAAEQPAPAAPEEPRSVDSRPPPMHQPVPLWEDGRTEAEVDAAEASLEGYVVVDLGEEWTPYILTDRDNPEAEQVPNAYRETYLALARGEFPEDHHGDRARRDKYLELYGIMPTLGVLRERMRTVSELDCAADLDLAPLHDFDGFIAYRNNERARRDARSFLVVERQVREIVDGSTETDAADLDLGTLSDRDHRRVRDYLADRAKVAAIRTTQARLDCEGFYEGKGRWTPGAMDWGTHEALAEFERRHRVYGWGFIGRDTLEALRRTPLENEQEAVVRVLTERAMHAAGVIEDGSTARGGEPQTFLGADGEQHEIPNLEAQLRDEVVRAFGLESPESTLQFLESLGELPADGSRLVAIRRPELPEYYDGNMPLFAEVNRGDVWYEFPFDADGTERSQPMQRRPRLTIYTRYLDHRIALARFGTTIGGWRTEIVDGHQMWSYKNSPTGPRVWHQIVASPVWLPPESSPPRGLLSRNPRGRGAERYLINYHEVGPSYASAYGLVAAYHLKFSEDAEGNIRYGGDEGIRTHGSVDYMSIMRRHSHGCHRLHNHIAVRMMSFVLAHRPHRRVGQQEIGFRRAFDYEGHTYRIEMDQGGYVFQLEEPVHMTVLEGRVRGSVTRPIAVPLPKFDDEIGAFMLPDGGAVEISRGGAMNAIPVPVPDAGVPPGMDAGFENVPVEELPLPLPRLPPSP